MIFFLKAVSFILGHIPPAIASFAGRLFGALIYRLDGGHRRRVLENLDRAFRDSITQEEKDRIARNVFIHLSTVFFEFMRIPWLRRDSLKGYVECEGLENLRSALSRERGVIFLTAHLGNWELMAAYYGLTGFPVDIVARDLDNPAFEGFVKWVRTRGGNRVVSKNRAMRRLLKRLSENGVIGILLDQNVAHAEGVFVDFFGIPACTNKGPALLAATSGAAVVPTFIVREGKGHRIMIGKEVELSRTGDREKDAVENTARCTKVIEDMIRKHPDQWFWVHRRWKTRPE